MRGLSALRKQDEASCYLMVWLCWIQPDGLAAAPETLGLGEPTWAQAPERSRWLAYLRKCAIIGPAASWRSAMASGGGWKSGIRNRELRSSPGVPTSSWTAQVWKPGRLAERARARNQVGSHLCWPSRGSPGPGNDSSRHPTCVPAGIPHRVYSYAQAGEAPSRIWRVWDLAVEFRSHV